ncbi:MAG: SRPBCC domain-containing protein [Shimia sp.]
MAPGYAPNPNPGGRQSHFTAIMTLEVQGDGTFYTATALHATQAARDTHEAMGFSQGWGMTADQLGSLAATL